MSIIRSFTLALLQATVVMMVAIPANAVVTFTNVTESAGLTTTTVQ